jgi:hypothetical protein
LHLFNQSQYLNETSAPIDILDVIATRHFTSTSWTTTLFFGGVELVVLIAIILLAANARSILLTFSGKKKR